MHFIEFLEAAVGHAKHRARGDLLALFEECGEPALQEVRDCIEEVRALLIPNANGDLAKGYNEAVYQCLAILTVPRERKNAEISRLEALSGQSSAETTKGTLRPGDYIEVSVIAKVLDSNEDVGTGNLVLCRQVSDIEGWVAESAVKRVEADDPRLDDCNDEDFYTEVRNEALEDAIDIVDAHKKWASEPGRLTAYEAGLIRGTCTTLGVELCALKNSRAAGSKKAVDSARATAVALNTEVSAGTRATPSPPAEAPESRGAFHGKQGPCVSETDRCEEHPDWTETASGVVVCTDCGVSANQSAPGPIQLPSANPTIRILSTLEEQLPPIDTVQAKLAAGLYGRGPVIVDLHSTAFTPTPPPTATEVEEEYPDFLQIAEDLLAENPTMSLGLLAGELGLAYESGFEHGRSTERKERGKS